MTMVKWDMDVAIFGYPQYGYRLATSREFTTTLGDKGRSFYIPYNPTSPIPVALTFVWDGLQMAAFREAWEDRNRLCFGANWFTITFPLYLNRIPGGTFPAHFVRPFNAASTAYNSWQVTFDLDFDQAPQLVLS